MYARRVSSLAIILMSWGLVGCGLTIPEIKEVFDADYPGIPEEQTPPVSGTAQIEFEIKKKVFCELKDAVAAANNYPVTETAYLGGPRTVKYRSLIPPRWIAQIALSLQVDESVSLNPGLSFTHFMANATRVFGVQNSVTIPQSFNLGLGANLSSTATRTDKFTPQYSIAFLSRPKKSDSVCHPKNDPFKMLGWSTPLSSPFLIESNLGIEKWLIGAMVVNAHIPSDITSKGGGSTKADAVSYEIKFVIVSNGNVTPTWKLVRVSANTGNNPFFGLGRTRTHDLIITIGPDTTATSNAHLASMISTGVASANRALFTTTGTQFTATGTQ
jgi:hypothetical protein